MENNQMDNNQMENNQMDNKIASDRERRSNNNILKELATSMYAGQKGYWLSRNYETNPDWNNLPFADFYENLSDNHKKMWLNLEQKLKPKVLGFEGFSLIPLYNGIIQTQKIVVGTGYFVYSALIVNLHLRLAKYSRELGVEASVVNIYNNGNQQIKNDIHNRALALRIAAYIIYEGDGLGGYKDNTWLLWGRLKGIACPDNQNILDADEAAECAELYFYASKEERKQLFTIWFKEISENHNNVPTEIIEHIFTAYNLVSRYQQMENPNIPEEYKFNHKSVFDIQAAICGFFRRSSKGVMINQAYNPNDLTLELDPFASMLEDTQNTVIQLLLGNENKLTTFGEYYLKILQINLLRNELLNEIVQRQEDPYAEHKYQKFGFKIQTPHRKSKK